MIFFPNWTVVHRDDVVEPIKEEFRKQAAGAGPCTVADPASWDAVDQASWESFPASDPPSWTLGFTAQPAADRIGRRGRPHHTTLDADQGHAGQPSNGRSD
jgi:hypothetical protein